MDKEQSERNTFSRREILKKAKKSAAFVVPTVVTFKLSELKAQTSGTYIQSPPPAGTGGSKSLLD